jgi:FdhD protein
MGGVETLRMAEIDAVRFDDGKPSNVSEVLAPEDVLQININGNPFSVTMRSPGNDEELVRGLLYTEHVLEEGGYEYAETRDARSGRVLAVEVTVDPALLSGDVVLSRSLLSTSSCGLCGRKEMEEMGMGGEPLSPLNPLSARSIPGMQEIMRARQELFAQSGGSHAAALFTLDAESLAVYEDIGRHNAVDKAVGSLLLQGKLDSAECLLVSGRVSYEIVMKAYAARTPFIVAVSAPSSLAAKTCDQLGISLLGFCRETRATVYSHPENVV